MMDRKDSDRRTPETARENGETKRKPPANRPAHNEQGICVDERGQDQPEDKDRAQKNR